MGFAVRANQEETRHIQGSPTHNVVSLQAAFGPQPAAQTQHPTQTQTWSSESARPRLKVVGSPAAPQRSVTPSEVRQLPQTPRLPLGLKLLVGVQQGSTMITGGLVAAALVIYSWTVYLDKAVVRAFRELETLKVSTQQVTTANETLKHSMAEQAEAPAAGFKPFEPRRAIFVAPAPPRPTVTSPADAQVKAPGPMPHPLGY